MEPLDPQRFTDELTKLRGGNEPVTMIMPQEELAEYLAQGSNLVLTDDYVPVDQLIATLFDERGY